jgi:hypothetical protein
MKALMSIQHEVAKVHQQQKVNGAVSKDDAGDVWTLLKYVDLVCPSHVVFADPLAVRSLRVRQRRISSRSSRYYPRLLAI